MINQLNKQCKSGKLKKFSNLIVINFLENHKKDNKIKVVTMSEVDTERAIEALTNYMDSIEGEGSGYVLYGMETWETEFFLFNFSLNPRIMI